MQAKNRRRTIESASKSFILHLETVKFRNKSDILKKKSEGIVS